MSQTQGDLSGARPTQEYSGCEQSLTNITFGAGPGVQHYRQPQQPSDLHYPSQQTYQDDSQNHHQQHIQAQEGSRAQATAVQHLHRGANLVYGGHANTNSFYGNPANQGINAATDSHQQPLGAGSEHVGGLSPVGAGDPHASPQDLFLPPQVYDNSNMLKDQVDHDDNAGDDHEDRDGGDFDDGGDGNSQGSGKRSRTRRPHLQGRFSGRLTTKEDERRLAEECKLLGPLLGGVGKRGDKSRLTLAKIVRGIATGDVRRFCEERERAIGMLKAKLAAIDPDAAASVPVNPIPLASGLGLGLGGPMGGLGGPLGSLGPNPSSMGMGMGMGVGMGGLGMGGHSRQLETLQRENAELQREMHNLRLELQARERLLLELQDTGIISGFVPTSIPLDEPSRMLSHHQSGPMSGMAGGGGRSHSADLQPPPYGLPPRHQSYSQQPPHVGSYGAPSQMSLPQSSAHVSSGMEPGPMGGPMALGHPMAQQQPQPGLPPAAGGATLAAADSVSMGASMPAMSEHSRAGRPMKRPAMAELGGGGAGGGGGGAGGAYGEVARSMSHPPLGRGGGASGSGYQHIDLQQQLNSLQAQVEHLQNLSQAQGSRSAAGYLMPARERNGLQQRMAPGGSAGPGGGGSGGGPLQYGGPGSSSGPVGAGGVGGPSPFLSSLATGQGQGGLLMIPSAGHHQADSGGHPYHAHPGIGAPLQLQLQVVKPDVYDDGGVGRDPRDSVGPRHVVGVADGGGPYGGGGAGLDATLEHMINSRAMRGEYDLPLEMLLPDGAGKPGGPGPGPH